MSLHPIGGIFARLDASGNLTFYDSSGNVVGKFIGGVFSTHLNYNTAFIGIADVTTGSLTDVSTGVGGTLTPQASGNVEVDVQATIFNTTGGDGCIIKAYVVAGAQPSAGNAVTGSRVGNTLALIVGTTPTFVRTSDIATSLTIGTQYSFYISITALTGGVATIRGSSNVALTGTVLGRIAMREV